ncbi:MAG: gamma-D-glutamyl-L-lysine dipeptidyl-peptidase [Gemmatimonadaceae bacterium]|nr:gamma-D-glutamyl-L-lysine dipeptidyl-peptidase [Gemmatimonadaceae bacterium]
MQKLRREETGAAIDAEPHKEDRLARALSEHVTAIAAIAPMLCEPDVRTTQVSQLLHGHIALVVERKGLWLHVKGADGYAGWVHQGYVVTMPEPVPALSETGWNDPRPLSLGCTVRDEHGATRKLPLGALVTEGQERFGGLAMTLDERRHSFPAKADSITATAMTYFEGTSYEWGGVTPWGCDCSGLVSSSFHLHGVDVPRDAWMQATTGEPVESIRDLRPADLLFFSDEADGKITHVAISLGGPRVVHLALGRGGYAVDDLTSRDEYSELLVQRFRFGRRIL